ncbi:MAG: hypothetical protein IPK82_44365 [Polyangiaceae bacterium]|nr:hypothetical protein [Polyangiaceae bacterium]
MLRSRGRGALLAFHFWGRGMGRFRWVDLGADFYPSKISESVLAVRMRSSHVSKSVEWACSTRAASCGGLRRAPRPRVLAPDGAAELARSAQAPPSLKQSSRRRSLRSRGRVALLAFHFGAALARARRAPRLPFLGAWSG